MTDTLRAALYTIPASCDSCHVVAHCCRPVKSELVRCP